MPISKIAQSIHTATTLAAAGADVDSNQGWLPIGLGLSAIATFTNGATGPNYPGASVTVLVADNSSGANAVPFRKFYQTDLTSGAVSNVPIVLGAGGNGGDYSHYRLRFGCPTGQNVTVSARGSISSDV